MVPFCARKPLRNKRNVTHKLPFRLKPQDGATLLHAAAEGGSKHILQVFLDSGCKSDLDCRENNGSQLSALHVAAEEGHSRATGALIRAGATVHLTDGDGRTPLHCAALHGHGNVVVDLLLNGADKEAEDEEGEAHHCCAFITFSVFAHRFGVCCTQRRAATVALADEPVFRFFVSPYY